MTIDRIERSTMRGSVQGFVDPAFAELADIFTDNFEARGEIGASVAIFHDGRPVASLWGGVKEAGGAAWEEDTISIVWSECRSSGFSRARTAFSEAIATASWSRSGSRVVRFCSIKPGHITPRTQALRRFLPAHLITS